MRVPVLVSFPDQEIEVRVTAEQIAAAIAEDTNSPRTCLTGINNAAQFIGAIPDQIIAEMSPEARKTVADFFTKQALRFT